MPATAQRKVSRKAFSPPLPGVHLKLVLWSGRLKAPLNAAGLERAQKLSDTPPNTTAA